MSRDYSISRAFDYVRRDGLFLVTGRQPHDWDMYIIKELIDNALDADDALWAQDFSKRPQIVVNVEYGQIQDRRNLIVEVRNRALFPTDKIQKILDPHWYTSSKSIIKGIQRGALGNAMKTLLGIPYAVRQRIADDYNPDIVPLSIVCKKTHYDMRYKIDPIRQTVELDIESRPAIFYDGTSITVRLDNFVQEDLRSLKQIQDLAHQYQLCNPHANFSWQVDIVGEQWDKKFWSKDSWSRKYLGPPHIQWYDKSFDALLNALRAERFSLVGSVDLPISEVCAVFTQPGDDSFAAKVQNGFGKDVISDQEITNESQMLFSIITENSLPFKPENLGMLGKDSISNNLHSYFPIKGDILYATIATESDGEVKTPFVLEACAARLNSGERYIWTAINFSPTYGDPFSRKSLSLPHRSSEKVLGLREFLGAYGFTDSSPVLLFLHLVCPNIVKQEYSKTEIEVLPFKKAVVKLLGQLLTSLNETTKESEVQFVEKVNSALRLLIHTIGPDERFVFEQILNKLRVVLSGDPEIGEKVMDTDSEDRLRALVLANESFQDILSQRVIQNTSRSITIPHHPNQYFRVPVKQLTNHLLSKNRVGKILYIQARELEPVIVENGWLCEFDMALLRNPPQENDLEETVYQCMQSSDLPLVVLHNADLAGKLVMGKIRKAIGSLDNAGQKSRVIDIGLKESDESENSPRYLVQMMPAEILALIKKGFNENGLLFKTCPSERKILADVAKSVNLYLRNYLWDIVFQEYEINKLMTEISTGFQIPELIREQALGHRIKERLAQSSNGDSYDSVMENITEEFFRLFLNKNDLNIKQVVSTYMANNRWDETHHG
jgi:hypothetical protein